MNSPSSFFKAEQLTPSSSPIFLSVDDQRSSSTSGFANLLASPTMFKLSDSNIANGNNNSGKSIFTTSLSKLNTYSRGRSNEKTNEKRSNSPMRYASSSSGKDQISTSSVKPVMFKQEFMSNYTSLPLLSTLLRAGPPPTNTTMSSSKPITSNSLNPLLDDNLPKLSIKETLERIQGYHQQQQQQQQQHQAKKVQSTPLVKSNPIPPVCPNVATISNYDVVPSEMTQSNEMVVPPLELHVTSHPRPNVLPQQMSNDRIVSNSSTLYSPDMVMDNFPTDNNGFIKYPKHVNVPQRNLKYQQSNNNNSNRYSFISSTSTDYDTFDLYDQNNINMYQQTPTTTTSQRSMRQTSGSSTNGANNNNNTNNVDINEFTSRLESSKLDLKIKQLEVEINELKLQNAKLMNGYLTSNPPSHVESRGNDDLEDLDELDFQLDENVHLRHKLKRLEKQIDNYKHRGNKNSNRHSYSKSNHIGRNLSISTKSSNSTNNTKNNQAHRISRISTKELQRFEETTDPSSSFSSLYSEEDDSEVEGNISQDDDDDDEPSDKDTLKNVLECEYEGDIDDFDLDQESHYSSNTTTTLHIPKRRGFNLNIPIEK